MGKVSSPSDFTSINPDYTNGRGFYTTHTDVSNLLQINSFTSSTTPTIAEVGKILKRVEENVDDKTKTSYRTTIYKDEFHAFEGFTKSAYPLRSYRDYVGFVQLSYPKVQKIVRLEVWQGNSYKDLASATASLDVPESATTNDWTITLTVGIPTTYTFTIRNLADNSVRDFYDNFGAKTTASQIVDVINEVYPMKTAKFTGETAAKTLKDTTNAVNISDFFYATTDSEDSSKVIISSLLMGEDGTNCTIASTYGTVTGFTDNQDQRRLGDYWSIGDEGKIFFHSEYPFIEDNGIRVTYLAGEGRVPATIHDAATKLVAAEVIRHDDNSILIAETNSNIDLKTKHDILIEEANKTLDGKSNMVYFIG